MNLLSYFPDNYTPYDYQISALQQISNAIKNNKKFIVVVAPTGSGKSFISKCIANKTDNHSDEFYHACESYEFNDISSGNGAFILTVTKKLQDQYIEFFDDIKACKGKQNFKCVCGNNITCDMGLCMEVKSKKYECLSCDGCPYYKQKKDAMQSKITVLNYDQFFSLEQPLTERDVIICDEASELENKLVEYSTLKIDVDELKKIKIDIPTIPTLETSLTWIVEINQQIQNRLAKYQSKKTLSSDDIKVVNILTALTEKIDIVISSWSTSDYILTHEINTHEFVFTPTYISTQAKLIFDRAKTVILMSATIINHNIFASTLGIKDYEYVEIPSVFDPKKAPIYISSKYKLNFKNLNALLPEVVSFIIKLCEYHKDQRGIIHTHTQYIADYIKSNYNSSRLLVRTHNTTNEQILAFHEGCKNSILVSPSLTHGVDLKDDLARFQIIVKVPWLPLGDVRVKKLANMNQQWYVSKMFSTLIQACGRGVRTKSDWCNTYILDGSIIPLIYQYKNILPKYFLDRIK